jgi:hypothetical protein
LHRYAHTLPFIRWEPSRLSRPIESSTGLHRRCTAGHSSNSKTDRTCWFIVTGNQIKTNINQTAKRAKPPKGLNGKHTQMVKHKGCTRFNRCFNTSVSIVWRIQSLKDSKKGVSFPPPAVSTRMTRVSVSGLFCLSLARASSRPTLPNTAFGRGSLVSLLPADW